MKKSQAETVIDAEPQPQKPPEEPRAAEGKAAPSVRRSSVAVDTPIIPAVEGAAGFSEVLVAHHDRGSAIAEEYRALRTSLLAQCPDERFCYLVTSAEMGEGKTITCLNLSLVMAERTDRLTVLVDCDLRRGKIAGHISADPSPGMADLLRGTVSLREAVQKTVYPNLFFLPAGHAEPDEVGEIIARSGTEEVISQLRRQYDYVILDTPPINAASDAGMFGRAAGEALLVVRLGKTRRESVDKAIRLLHSANVKMSGIVLTRRKYYIPNYLYRYS
jgi:capsular exopolysaccharide synthesis family protein